MNFKLLLLLIGLSIFSSCNESSEKKKTPINKSRSVQTTKKSNDIHFMEDKGVGPIKNLPLPSKIDETLVSAGHSIFKTKCSACHKIEKRFIGPEMKGIINRRSPEWIMNMILNPDEMILKNEAAKKLFAEYLSPMANQNLTQDEARSVLEYFRTLK